MAVRAVAEIDKIVGLISMNNELSKCLAIAETKTAAWLMNSTMEITMMHARNDENADAINDDKSHDSVTP